MTNKKGMTLMELSIVIAIIAIVVALSVTFTTLISRRVTVAKANDEVLSELSKVEMLVKNFVRHYDNADYYFKVDGKKLQAFDNKGDTDTANDVLACELSLSSGGTKLVSTAMSSFDVQYIKNLSFNLSKSASGHCYVDCLMTYYEPDGNTAQTIRYVFTTRAQNVKIRRNIRR